MSRVRWTLRLPSGAYRVPVSPPPECTSMVHLRGEIAPEAPFFGVVSTRPRDGRTPADLADELSGSFVEPSRPRYVRVSGSPSAVRLDGRIDMGEGLSEDEPERIATVVAQAGEELLVLTVRTRAGDAVVEAVDEIVASLTLDPPPP